MAPLRLLLSAVLLTSPLVANAAPKKFRHLDIDVEKIEAAGKAAIAQITSNSTSSKAWPKCKTISKRKEWRKYTYSEKAAYIAAVKCMATKPDFGITNLTDPNANLYDAYAWAHEWQDPYAHFFAGFLQWHRWFGWLWETGLRSQCNYKGTLPYWDYSLDSGNFLNSPVLSNHPVIGFGGDGTTPDNSVGIGAGIVTTGAFANFKLHHPRFHYLQRNFSWIRNADFDPNAEYGPNLDKVFTPKEIKRVLSLQPYALFRTELEGYLSFKPVDCRPHGALHFAIGGDLLGPPFWIGTPDGWHNGAPNDPLFYLHHAGVDYYYWKWQQKSTANQWDFAGNRPGTNVTVQDATVSDIMHYEGVGPDIPIALAMKTENYPLCFTYT